MLGFDGRLAVDELHLASTRALGRLFHSELYTLTLTEQFEDGTSHLTAVEEVLDSSFIANKTKALIDEEPCNGTAWHTLSPPIDEAPGPIPRDDETVCRGSQGAGMNAGPQRGWNARHRQPNRVLPSAESRPHFRLPQKPWQPDYAST